jgi:hypothetical protein
MLGVPRDAAPEAIKRAYRRLALRHHPDRDPSPDAAERFRRLHRAYRLALEAPCPPPVERTAAQRPAVRRAPVPDQRPPTRRDRFLFRALHATGCCFALVLLATVGLAFVRDLGVAVQLLLALPGLAILPDSIAGLRR